jgi:FKBP12-rapamycin complex-associated protein
VVFEHCVALWKRLNTADAVDSLNRLVRNKLLPDKDPLAERGLTTLARWIIRSDYREAGAASLIETAKICQLASESNKKARLFYVWTQLSLYNLKEGDREMHAIEAIRWLIRIATGISEMMQLCSIVFRAGRFRRVFETVVDDLYRLDITLWLPLIPQLFAQLSNESRNLAEFARRTISEALAKHHHAVIFALLFSVGFAKDSVKIATDMLDAFRKEQSEVVENAHKIYIGLLSACTTKTEHWEEVLNAVLEHFKQNNFDEMKTVFERHYESLRIENCDADVYFNRVYAERIAKFAPVLRFFFVSKNKKHLDQIWPDYKAVLAAMKADIDAMTSIPLHFVSPLLADVRDVNIAVPGTYEPGKPVTMIARFSTSMDVFPSKQRPKRFAIIGSDGHEVWYLLKGHEDIRLEQRVVQLFSLLNSFIPAEMPQIVTDFILPLSPMVGLIQWIPGSDTMFKLIREFRATRGIQTDAELRMLGGKSIAKIDSLRPIHRLELLGEVSRETPSTVLASIMWLKAPNSETWVRRVSTFSRTSGLMSVVGYLLGIGDRHPSNIMIHKYSGSVIHVDFGDCFESAKERVLFPELIPFRLTRFMVKAFGPSGIDGAFRRSCVNMIKLIRAKREVILSVLEIFAHAPLMRSMSNKRSGIDEDEYVARITMRVNEKIMGMDFDSDHPLSPEEQVSMLIGAATDMYHMAHLFHGWKPLW